MGRNQNQKESNLMNFHMRTWYDKYLLCPYDIFYEIMSVMHAVNNFLFQVGPI